MLMNLSMADSKFLTPQLYGISERTASNVSELKIIWKSSKTRDRFKLRKPVDDFTADLLSVMFSTHKTDVS